MKARAEGIMAKPIQAEEVCKDFEHNGAEDCGQPARYAYIVTQESCLCEGHKPKEPARGGGTG